MSAAAEPKKTGVASVSHVARKARADALSNAGRIVAAARVVFSRGDGLGSLNAIADEAGVGIATLYRHFPNREALARAVYESIVITEIAPELAKRAGSGDARGPLLDVAERLLDLTNNQQGLIASIHNFPEATRDLMRHLTGPLGEVLRSAQAAGSVREDLAEDDIPQILAMLVVGLNISGTTAETRKRYLSFFLDALAPPAVSTQPGSRS